MIKGPRPEARGLRPYIELHACSAFSFLEGSSLPEDLVEEAARLEYPALALLDHNGVYGAPRFYKACREAGIRALVGAEASLKTSQGLPFTQSPQLPLLVENRTGYQNLCRLITRMKIDSKKGEGTVDLTEMEEFSSGLVCLTGGDRGPLRAALNRDGVEQASQFLTHLKNIFGPKGVFVEIQRHFDREQEQANQALIDLARRLRLPLIATNGVRYSQACGRPLLDALTCIRHKTTLEQAGRLLSRNAECYLKSPREMTRIFADLPEAAAHTVELAQRLQFTLQDLGYRFPEYPLPVGENMSSYLRKLTEQGARRRYRPYHSRARQQIARELDLIEKLELPGYFLIVWDIVRFCREQDIMVQGRGSAANSAVCYSLGITAVDPIGMDLLFERFLSEKRGEWPDIDLDLPSGNRRERVIQHVYEKYGRRGAAMTANVITYRGRSAAREMGKVLAFQTRALDRLSSLLGAWPDPFHYDQSFREAGFDLNEPRVRHFMKLWDQIQDLPRHLGQHSGGLVMSQGALDSVVPLEKAALPGRTVVQWDKDDCADLGIIKVDLLGLGMMSVLQDSIRLIRDFRREEVDLAHLPADDPAVYEMLQKADTVGVFQVESRAQMATLPRLKPKCFYDLVVEVAIIRPGPIVGQMVHPYLRRRAGLEPVSYAHPSLEPILKRTLGVPLFQEQLLKIAMTTAGFSGAEAEELRRALSFKRSAQRMQKVEVKLRQGMAQKGISGETAESIIRSISSFALYGFPESHAASFALLAYASAYLKAHYPAAFYAALLNNQPMGFYHPSTLVKDAQHRGQRIRPIDVMKSNWLCSIEKDGSIRLGLMFVAGMREEAGKVIERERNRSIFTSSEDLKERAGLRKAEMATLAEIGALNSFGMRRREALWQIEKLCRPAGPLFANTETSPFRPLKDMTPQERLLADYSGTGLTLGPHPMALLRRELSRQGIVQASALPALPDGRHVRVGGVVIVRQRPTTARGFLFISLEDETGIANIVIRPPLFESKRATLVGHPFLIFEGVLQNQNNVTSVRAEKVWPLPAFDLTVSSHDFS
ncbi:MAG: DNA polymerase III subunit alpha [Acidobacteriota bacterium]